jgi:hypothetical protein
MLLHHSKSITIADGTNTDIVRPADWNQSHVGRLTITGNTDNASTWSGTNLVLSGGNNVTLKLSNNSLEISGASPPAALGALYDGANSITSGTARFSNSNGVSIGFNGQTVTLSHNGLTTARASNDGIGLATAGTNVTWTVNSGGLSLNAGAYLTTAALSNHSHGNPTLALTNLSGTTGSNSGGLTLSLSAAAQSVQTQNLHNVTLSGNTAGVMAQVSSGTLTLAGGNNITLSQNGNAVTISGGAAGGADGVNALVVNGGVSSISTTLTLSNSNNVSFGLNAGVITATATFAGGGAGTGFTSAGANIGLSGTLSTNGLSLSATVPAQSVQTQNLVSVQGSTGAISFSNSNGVSFGFNASTITASHNGLTTAALSNHSHGFSAAGGSSGFQTLVFSNSNGITFSNSNGSVVASHNGLTTARASNDGVGLNTAATNVTWTVNSSGISLNAGGYLTTAALSNHGHAFSADASSTFQTLSFQNSNGVSFSNNAGALRVTHALQFTSNTTDIITGRAGLGTTFGGANISASITLNTAGLNLSASVAAPGAAAENNWFHLIGNTSNASTASGSTISLSGGTNITLAASNGSIIKIEGAAGGGGGSVWHWIPFYGSVATMAANASFLILPVALPAALSMEKVQVGIYLTNSSNSTGSLTLSMAVQLFTKNGGSLSNLVSGSRGFSLTFSGTTNSGTYIGLRAATIPLSSNLTPGQYWLGFYYRSTTGGTNMTVGYLGAASQINSNFGGPLGENATNSGGWLLGWGSHSLTGSSSFASIAFSDIRPYLAISRSTPWVVLSNSVTA